MAFSEGSLYRVQQLLSRYIPLEGETDFPGSFGGMIWDVRQPVCAQHTP